MALAPKPITLVVGTNPNPETDPQPMIVVGGLPTKTQVAGLTNVTTADATAAAGSTPTKAEFDALVTLANATKAKVNQIIAALKA